MPSLAFTRLARMASSNPFRWAVCADLGAVDEMRNARKSRSMESGNRHWPQPRGDPETRNHVHSETRSKFIILNSARLLRLCRLRNHMQRCTSCMHSARGQLPTAIAIKTLAKCYALHYSQHDGQEKLRQQHRPTERRSVTTDYASREAQYGVAVHFLTDTRTTTQQAESVTSVGVKEGGHTRCWGIQSVHCPVSEISRGIRRKGCCTRVRE